LYIEFCKRKKKEKIHSDLYRHYKYIFCNISDRFHFSFFYNYRLFRLGGRSYVSMSGAQLCVRWNSITRGELFRKHVSAATIPECYRYSTEASCSKN
jgi:hypothetical protein